MLFLSLRIDTNAESIVKSIHIKADREELDHIEVVQKQKTVKITPLMFSSQLRPKIAEQNGLELPDESQDPNLVRDAEEKRKSESDGHNDFNFSVEDMIFSVAHAEHIRPKEIRKTWSVKEFEGIRRAIDREKNFIKYGQAEMSGMVTFKKGNPYPSWEFDRKDDSLGMIALGKSGMAKMFGDENQQQNQ